MDELRGKLVLVMGLGRFGGGVGVTKWLVGQGARVVVNDALGEGDLAESIGALEGLPVEFKLGGHLLADFLGAELLVINPAVDKEKSEPVGAALAAGIPYTTEMNLFVERCPALTVGITGSVGKSTTTVLVYEALKAGMAGSGRRVFMGGNIGRSLLGELEGMTAGDVVVLELSSFMLEDTPEVKWSPIVVVVTNVYPNHLDRHGGTMAGYEEAKKNILRFQRPEDVAILNGDHEVVSSWGELARGKVVKFSVKDEGGRMELLIPGVHNQSNAAAAMAAVGALEERGVKVDRGAAVGAIEGFAGLSHRLALVHSVTLEGGRIVRFYNDSKATSPDASVTALRAFEMGSAIFLVGGYDKHVEMSEFERELAGRAAGVIGIGQTGEALVKGVLAKGGKQAVYCGTLEGAMSRAREWAAADGAVKAVVLSPGSASWGQFANYEKRGERFIELCKSY